MSEGGASDARRGSILTTLTFGLVEPETSDRLLREFSAADQNELWRAVYSNDGTWNRTFIPYF